MVNTRNTSQDNVSMIQANSISVGAGSRVEGCTVDMNNTAMVNVTFMSKIDSQTVMDLKGAMTGELKNKASQTVKIIREMMANVGTSNSDSISNTIVNRVQQIVEKNVTVKKVNEILRGVLTHQQNTITIHPGVVWTCPASDPVLRLSNNIQLTILSTSIISDIVNIAVKDDTIMRITNDATQDVTIKAEGLAGLIRALTGPMIAVVIAGIIAFAVLGKQAFKSVADPKFMMIFGGVMLGYVGVAYFTKLWPFQKKDPNAKVPSKTKQPWLCATFPDGSLKGQNTGGCVQWMGSGDPPSGQMTWGSKGDCDNDSQNQRNPGCPMFWGCGRDISTNFTGRCAQTNNALDGPYHFQVECEDHIRSGDACRYYWGCGDGLKDDPKGDTGTCYPFDNVSDGPFKTETECKDSKTCTPSPSV